MNAAIAQTPVIASRGLSARLHVLLLAAAAIVTLAWTGLLGWIALRGILILLDWIETL